MIRWENNGSYEEEQRGDNRWRGGERKDGGRNGREEEGRVRLLLKYNPKLSSDNSAGFDLVENEEEYMVMRKESGL